MPDTFVEFCSEWRKRFPATYDTKVVNFQLSQDVRNNRSSLEDLYNKVTKDKLYFNNLKIKFDTDADREFGAYQDGQLKLHDAAFDAYMTGNVFAMLTKRVEIEKLLQTVPDSKEDKKLQQVQVGTKRAQKKAAKDEMKVRVAGGLPDQQCLSQKGNGVGNRRRVSLEEVDVD